MRNAPGPVLVVDDDAVARQLFRAALEEGGFRTIEARDGAEALRIAAETTLGAVLLDNLMPGLSGLETLARLRAMPRTQTLPVILVTGRSEVRERVHGLEAGADDYLVKPVALEELVARVRAHLRGQAVWLRQLETHLRERNRVVSALCRLRPERTPERTADMLCRALVEDRPGAVAGVITFAGGAVGRLLAIAGGDAPGIAPAIAPGIARGEELPPAVAAAVHRAAQRGPWTESGATGPTTGIWRLLGSGVDGPLTVAPMRSGSAVVGLLVVGGPPLQDAPVDDALGQRLSAAMDYASVAAALLGPALAQRDELQMLRAGIGRVLRERAFDSVFQPIVPINGVHEPGKDAVRGAAGFEALTRLRDGTPPAVWFGEAARLGIGHEVERVTLEESLRAARGLPGDAWLSLNASPSLLLTDDALGDLLATADRPIVIELTERERIDDYAALRSAVRRLGPDVQLSIDDAGSGYACLQHVLSLQPAFVKLDRSWIHDIASDPSRQALVAGLSHFSRQTGCRLIAEGIEAADELAVLRDLAVELGQGFLLGRPATASA